jgi:hypothetical protein
MSQHDDKTLNALRWVAFGAVGLYFFKTWQKEGSLGKVGPGGARLDVNTDRIVDSAMPWLGLPSPHRELVREGAKQFLGTLKEEVLGKVNKK